MHPLLARAVAIARENPDCLLRPLHPWRRAMSSVIGDVARTHRSRHGGSPPVGPWQAGYTATAIVHLGSDDPDRRRRDGTTHHGPR